MYVFQLFDFYSASGSALLWVSLFQSIAIGWIYGKQSIHHQNLFYKMSAKNLDSLETRIFISISSKLYYYIVIISFC